MPNGSTVFQVHVPQARLSLLWNVTLEFQNDLEEKRAEGIFQGVTRQGWRVQARMDASYRRPWQMPSAPLLVESPKPRIPEQPTKESIAEHIRVGIGDV